MQAFNRRLTSAILCVVAGLLMTGASQALTVTKALPQAYIPADASGNPIFGTGATLSILELPAGGRQFFFAFYANDDSGNPTWVVANTGTTTGFNAYTVDLFTTTGSTFNPTSTVGAAVVGSADIVFKSCNAIDVTYSLTAGGSGTINFVALTAEPTCPWTTEFGAASCPAFSAGADPDIPGACILPATLNTDTTLTNDLHWVIGLSGFRFGDDLGPSGGTPATLTIEPGTVIVGENLPAGSQDLGAFFSISRGNKIVAVGGPETPIVFTSKDHLLTGNLEAGQWGGVVIAGRGAPNDCDPTTSCLDEIQLNEYGGSDNDDSSGELRYVRIEYAGTQISSLSELNGLSLYTVGNGTVMEYIHVHRNGDDGIEWFGGAGNMKYAIVTAADDDSFDMTQGAQPKLQYGIAHMSEAAVKDARGFEWDGQEGNEGAEPRTRARFANVTIYYEAGVGEGPQQALRIRRGALFNITNSVVASAADDLAPSDCLRIDGPQINQDVIADANNGTITNTVLACQGNLFDDNESDLLESTLFNGGAGNTTDDPMLMFFAAGARIGSTSNNPLIPAANSPAANIGQASPALFDDFFDKVNWAGAIRPGASPEEDWTAGEWTNVDPDENL
ncbi:MAG: hypothetical protein QNJ40_00945 [Xanthomonadales bacterium]|nr:hypothetical protein [Xanthomonadales bacterium]